MTGGQGHRYVAGVPVTDHVLDRWRQLPPLFLDAALAAVVAAVTIVSTVVEDHNDHGVRLSAFGWALLALQLVPLVWRRRAPVVVLALSMGGAIAYGMARLPDPANMFAPALAVYSVAAHRPRSVSVPCALVVIVAAGLGVVFGDESDAADVSAGYFVGITSWMLGDIVRGQRERAAWLDARRVDEAQRAAADERVRIARDLHDVAARPDRAQAAMATVADTARSALGELRRLLGVLRSEATVTPQPDLAAVDDLVASVREAGLDVSLRTRGNGLPVAPVVGLTAYRVVQEALTNVLRHAHATRADVELAVGDTELIVTVSDDGRSGASVNGTGHGLVGMRERVSMLGGHLDAGPRPEGGFRVRAQLPPGA